MFLLGQFLNRVIMFLGCLSGWFNNYMRKSLTIIETVKIVMSEKLFSKASARDFYLQSLRTKFISL